MAFFVTMLWSMMTYAADPDVALEALKKAGVLVSGKEKVALTVLQGLEQNTWMDFGWVVKIVGLLIVLLTLHAYIVKIIKSIWFLLSRIPLMVYQMGALMLTAIPTVMPTMIWEEQYEIVGMISGVAFLGSLGWIVNTYKLILLKWCERVKIPTNIRLLFLITIVCGGLSWLQHVWWWMIVYPCAALPMLCVKSAKEDRYSWNLDAWSLSIKEHYVPVVIGVGYLLLGDPFMIAVFTGIVAIALIFECTVERNLANIGIFMPSAIVAIGISGTLIPVYAIVAGWVGMRLVNGIRHLFKSARLFTTMLLGLFLMGMGIVFQSHLDIVSDVAYTLYNGLMMTYWSWPEMLTLKAYF